MSQNPILPRAIAPLLDLVQNEQRALHKLAGDVVLTLGAVLAIGGPQTQEKLHGGSVDAIAARSVAHGLGSKAGLSRASLADQGHDPAAGQD